MKFVDWLIWEKVPISDIKVNEPAKELRIFTAYALFFVLVVGCFSLLIRFCPLPMFENTKFTDDLWYIVFVKLVFLLVFPIHIYKKCGYEIRSLFNLINPGWISIFFPLGVGLLLNMGHIAKITPLLQLGNAAKIVLALLLPLITAAIPEEIFYRRILQTRVEKVGGWFLSILVSSALFSLFHLPSRFLLSAGVEGQAGNLVSVTVGTLLPTFILGLIFGFLWNRYRNIFMLISLHYGIDVLPSLSSLLGVMD